MPAVGDAAGARSRIFAPRPGNDHLRPGLAMIIVLAVELKSRQGTSGKALLAIASAGHRQFQRNLQNEAN
jgi:hypothetical protein